MLTTLVKMKVFGFWVLVLVFGTASQLFCGSSARDTASPLTGNGMTIATSVKEIKGKEINSLSNVKREILASDMNLEDYRLIDPVPSSSTITSGPIEHGTPLFPYIPKPSPPYHPNQGISPSPPAPA